MIKTYETERLLLRPTQREDAAFIYKLLNSEKWLKYIGDRQVYTLAAAEDYIQNRILVQYETLGYGNFTVIRKDDFTKMGSCGIYSRQNLAVQDIGFAFLEEYEGKGYAFEAATKLKELAKEEFGLKKLAGITLECNHSSRKLLEKLGLGFQKKFFMEGDPEELMYYETAL